MDKKPLIGVSILAVVLLVLGSLSNVVGLQSVNTPLSDSPTFVLGTQNIKMEKQEEKLPIIFEDFKEKISIAATQEECKHVFQEIHNRAGKASFLRQFTC